MMQVATITEASGPLLKTQRLEPQSSRRHGSLHSFDVLEAHLARLFNGLTQPSVMASFLPCAYGLDSVAHGGASM